jgi:hypothetical protein
LQVTPTFQRLTRRQLAEAVEALVHPFAASRLHPDRRVILLRDLLPVGELYAGATMSSANA